MIKCIKISFHTDKYTMNTLFECNRLSAIIWNDILSIAKNYSLNNNNQWINKSQLQLALKNKYPLHSQSVQSVAHKYLFSRDSSHKAKLKGISTSKYPYKEKKYFNTKWIDKAFSITNNIISLSMGTGKPRPHSLKLKINKKHINLLKDKEIKEIELIYDRRLMLSLSYDDNHKIIQNNNTNFVGVDLGEIHSISAYNTNGQALIITGRQLRSINRLRNKKLRELQKKISKCKKYSRQWKKYNHAKQFILSKSNKQLTDLLHKTTKQFIDWCVENNTKTVVIGNPEGVQRNTKKHIKVNKNNRQKLSNWSFGKFKQQLEYKLSSANIKVILREESYTTQTCPVCGRRNKCKSRIYKCQCGFTRHRDIHGSYNILSKELNKNKIYNNIGEIEQIIYKKPNISTSIIV